MFDGGINILPSLTIKEGGVSKILTVTIRPVVKNKYSTPEARLSLIRENQEGIRGQISMANGGLSCSTARII